MSNYARGKYAYGYCDLTGFRYSLNDLLYTTHEGVRTGMRVGRDVYDPDQPQNWLGAIPVSDPQAMWDPRPQGGTAGRGLFAWNPVGDGNTYPILGPEAMQTMRIASSIGTPTITTS